MPFADYWWLDDYDPESPIWARLRLSENGSAEVFDCDRITHSFTSKAEAEAWLREDEYVALAEYVHDNPNATAPAPPNATRDALLIPLMSSAPEHSHASIARARAELRQNPCDLGCAWRYWQTLGPAQTGMYAREAFEPSARTSDDGLLAFAVAYNTLYAQTGEGPRDMFVHPEIETRARSLASSLELAERDIVKSFLDSLRWSRETDDADD